MLVVADWCSLTNNLQGALYTIHPSNTRCFLFKRLHCTRLLCIYHTHTKRPTWWLSTPLPTPSPSHGTNLLMTTQCSYREKQQTTYLSLGSYNWLMWQDRLHTLWKGWTHSDIIALVSSWLQTMDMEVMQQWSFKHVDKVRMQTLSNLGTYCTFQWVHSGAMVHTTVPL